MHSTKPINFPFGGELLQWDSDIALTQNHMVDVIWLKKHREKFLRLQSVKIDQRTIWNHKHALAQIHLIEQSKVLNSTYDSRTAKYTVLSWMAHRFRGKIKRGGSITVNVCGLRPISSHHPLLHYRKLPPMKIVYSGNPWTLTAPDSYHEPH